MSNPYIKDGVYITSMWSEFYYLSSIAKWIGPFKTEVHCLSVAKTTFHTGEIKVKT